MQDRQDDLVELTAHVVCAYVGNNPIPRSELAQLIATTHAALSGLGTAAPEQKSEPPVPAVPVKKSITPDAIICLEDGKAFKSMKRHLMSAYGMTPDQYRAKWGLPSDYPMVAASYSERRSSMAKAIGLGRVRGDDEAPASEDEGGAGNAPARRGRPPKAAGAKGKPGRKPKA